LPNHITLDAAGASRVATLQRRGLIQALLSRHGACWIGLGSGETEMEGLAERAR